MTHPYNRTVPYCEALYGKLWGLGASGGRQEARTSARVSSLELEVSASASLHVPRRDDVMISGIQLFCLQFTPPARIKHLVVAYILPEVRLLVLYVIVYDISPTQL